MHARIRGFTLVEALVVLAIIGILLAASAPALGNFANRLRLTSHTSRFVAHLHLARSEAMKHGSAVVLCKSNDGVSCMPTGHWDQGWIVFHDDDNDALRDPGEAIIEHAAALPGGWRVSGNQNVSRYISYHPRATTQMSSGAFQAGTITVCRIGADTTEGRTIVLNAAGRPRMQAVTLQGCA